MEAEVTPKQIVLACHQQVAQGMLHLTKKEIVGQGDESGQFFGALSLMRQELKVMVGLFLQYSELRDLVGSHRFQIIRELSRMQEVVTTILATLPQFYTMKDDKSIIYQKMRMHIEDGIDDILKIWESVDTILSAIK